MTNIAGTLRIWAVTTARPYSTIQDVCFETTPRGLVLQGLGGLLDREPSQSDARAALVAVYDNEADAKRHGAELIEAAKLEAVR